MLVGSGVGVLVGDGVTVGVEVGNGVGVLVGSGVGVLVADGVGVVVLVGNGVGVDESVDVGEATAVACSGVGAVVSWVQAATNSATSGKIKHRPSVWIISLMLPDEALEGTARR